MMRRFRSPFLARVLLFTLFTQLLPGSLGAGRGVVGAAPPDAQAFRTVLAETLRLSTDEKTSVPLPALRRDRLYSVTVTLGPGMPEMHGVAVALRAGDQNIGAKTLHGSDPDLYVVIRPPQNGSVKLEITGPGQKKNAHVAVKVVEWNVAADTAANVAYKSGSGWKHAAPMTLGEVVFGSGDLAPYIPTDVPETTRWKRHQPPGRSCGDAGRTNGRCGAD